MATPPYVRAARIAAMAVHARPGRRARLVLAGLASGWLMLFASAAPNARAATFEKAFWGPTEVNGTSQFPIYKDLGVTLYQMTVSWADVAPTRPADARNPRDPAYQWPPDVDQTIAQARRYGIKVLILLTQTPRWANSGRDPEYAPDRPSDFATFARATARRYPAVRHWMIWGEPSRSNNFKPFVEQPYGAPMTPERREAPERYARMLDACYGQLKAERRSNIVIGGNTYVTGEIRPLSWMRAMNLPDGRPPRMDYYGHNPFSSRNPKLSNGQSAQGVVDFSDLGRFDKEIQRELGRPRHKVIKLFLSEFTIPTGPDREFNFYVSPATQARWIASAFRVIRAVKNIVGLGWIHLYDEPPATDNTVVTGGLLTHDGKRKPGYFAFRAGIVQPGATLDVRN